MSFPDCTVIGPVLGGKVLINPPAETVISANDELVLIAEDDSTIRLGTPVEPATDAIVEARPVERVPERTLVLGYNRGLHAMLAELDEYVAPGSLVTVVADVESPVFDPFESLQVAVPAGRHVTPGGGDRLLHGARGGETALGYRLAEHAHTGSEAYGVRVNPLKSERFALSSADHVIVLAED